MQTRRRFLGTAAGLSATAFTGGLNGAPAGKQIKKSILISMLPKELSYLDQFKAGGRCRISRNGGPHG